MVKITIDGIEMQSRDGAMLIEAADEAGIAIPRFCYHKKLSVAANCRMCLVEVAKAGKPLPACATPVTDGMVVFTKSAKALDAQRGVMEFLLINHPLDCPICDQGGECELQDIAMGYGGSHSRFTEKKRVVADKNIGPLIATDMTRCIHCTRCVRFGEEIAGIKELGATGRGEHMQIGTYIEKAMTSEMSGNVIDLCPVGALTSKPFRYTARTWEMQSRPTIAGHDCIGSNITAHVKGKTVKRVVPRENEAINETWLSDRDRFAYEGLNSGERLQHPRILRDGKWQDVTWEVALEFTGQGLKSAVMKYGAGQLGALTSPSATVEEIFLLQKFMRGIGSTNVDHRLWQRDFTYQDELPVFPWLGRSIESLEKLDNVLLIGSNVRKDQPIASHRLRKATQRGATIMAINSREYGFNFPLKHHITGDNQVILRAVAGVLKAVLSTKKMRSPEGADALLSRVTPSASEQAIAQQLLNGGQSAIVLGVGAMAHPAYGTLAQLVAQIALTTGTTWGCLSLGANAAGAWLAGGVPHRGLAGKGVTYGLNARAMLEAGLKGYLLLGLELEQDAVYADAARAALNKADFVVCLSPYFNDTLGQYADVVLPVAPYTETSGTFVNAEGRWQSFAAVCEPLGSVRPAWKVLRVLGNQFGLAGFDYMSSEDVRDEVQQATREIMPSSTITWRCPASLDMAAEDARAVTELTPYDIDMIVRRAPALQATQDGLQTADASGKASSVAGR